MAGKLPTGITQTKSGKFAVRPYNKQTKKKDPQVLFDTLEEAVRFKTQAELDKLSPTARKWTVAEWVAHWTDPSSGYGRAKESTNRHYAERVKAFADEFGDRPLDSFDRPTARKWANANPGRLGPVRAMFTDAVQDGILPVNPFVGLGISRGGGRKRQQVPTPQELAALVDLAYEKWPDWPFYGSFIQTAAYTGLRIGELVALRWADIDWEAGEITVSRQWSAKLRDFDSPKNNQSRTVNLFPEVTEALRILPKDGPDGVVWRGPRGGLLQPNLHFYYWSQIRERWLAKLPHDRFEALKDIDFHSLRHFHASWLVDMGVPPADVAAQLGHTDGGYLVQTLYGHLYKDNSLNRMRKAYAARAAA